jgi:hypothetical protein
MLLLGNKIKDIREIVGEIPVGNTGGANVPPLKRMEIPADLKLIIEENK